MEKYITRETQEVIDYILKYESEISFKVCKTCGRKLPSHEWFYSKCYKNDNTYFVNSCKECTSKLYDEGTYVFSTALDRYWYIYRIDEVKTLFRIMQDTQLAKYFNKSIYTIEHLLYQTLKLSAKDRIFNLTKEEVIKIYEYVRSGEREQFPKGIFDNIENSKILLQYLFNKVLFWDFELILSNLNMKLLDKYHLYGLRKNKNFLDIVNLINNIYNVDFNIWQYKKSNVNHYFDKKENIDHAMNWFKIKLKEDKNIKSINEAYDFGFNNLVLEYGLYHGLVIKVYNNNHYAFFEAVFNEKFDKQSYYENRYPFDINPKINSLSKNLIVYKLTDKYYTLDDLGKTLINQVANFCEINNRFPLNNDFTNNKGNISYAYIKKYFGKYSNIYKYILPLVSIAANCWNISENRANYIRYYCENKSDISISTVIDNTEKLKDWTIKYFNQDIISKEMSWANDYIPSLYELLIEAYPQIKEQSIMFDWEWKSFYPKHPQRRFEILRELVLYRLNDLIKDLVSDIPKYLNYPFMDTIYPKFNTMIRKGKFKSYYEWACLAFPEYKKFWTEKDFGMVVARDNTILSSYQEKEIYELIKYNLGLEDIKYIGTKRKGNYTYSLSNISEYKSTCPDFVIESIRLNNSKIKLYKPIIIEFYGYYSPDNTNHIFMNYVNKTHVKNAFYKSRNDILFVDLYPEDLKHNYTGIKDKLNNLVKELKRTA